MPEPCCVQADRTRVKQVLLNLLSNAIKYNRVGGQVTVRCASKGGTQRVRISLQDTGAGLSMEQLGQLFQPFNRLGREGSAQDGTGIGLAMCKRLMLLMGGTIGVESTVGEGSLFWVEFDAAAAQADVTESGSTQWPPAPALAPGVAQRTVLCVEDNPANLLLVEKLIARRPDLRLIAAADGRAGVEMARKARPALVLMDLNLPGISGHEAQRILSSDPDTAHIPLIALSANAMPRDIEKGLQAGFFRYLTKPIKVLEFMETLDAALLMAASPANDPKKE
jgi:CheY-like chemotaxis protein